MFIVKDICLMKDIIYIIYMFFNGRYYMFNGRCDVFIEGYYISNKKK